MSNQREEFLWRESCRRRDRFRCRRCGSRWSLEVHHVFSRSFGATSVEPDNGVTLCKTHHDLAHAHSDRFKTWWMEQIGPARFEALRAKAYSHGGKILPRRVAQPPREQAAPTSPPRESGPSPAADGSLFIESLRALGCTDPENAINRAMAMLTMESSSKESHEFVRELNGLLPPELKAMILVLAASARGLIMRSADPNTTRAILALGLQQEVLDSGTTRPAGPERSS